ncbi:ribosomal silencing factor RsfS [Anaplasma platys]|uniref:Ribosomal silencing factor RsfS n=1 Tax=Anaplasma platys TaxID=949 RepID=A0A858PXJ9_9RICK|nr:ribosome silencing factor [Anaplasma platys]QJC27302.1 ribosomal silencing factor RsfS [Anaplasma platys]
MVNAEKLKNLVIDVLDSHSASDIVELDVTEKCQFAEYMVVATGNSTNHVRALAEHVKKAASPLKKARVEGLNECNWVVLSIGGVLVHIFRAEVREYYKLEDLWNAVGKNLGEAVVLPAADNVV